MVTYKKSVFRNEIILGNKANSQIVIYTADSNIADRLYEAMEMGVKLLL